MANSTAVTILDANSSAKTVSTLDAFITVAGTPSATDVMTIQTSTNPFNIGTVTSITSGTVAISGGTITSITSGTMTVLLASSSPALTAPGSPSATAALTVQPSTTTNPYTTILASSSPGITPLGQAAKAASLPVTIASDSSAFTTSLSTAGGYTVSSILLSTTTNATLVSSKASQLFHIEGFNQSTGAAFAKIYNLSSTPTVGTSSPQIFYAIPNSSVNTAGAISEYVNGVPFTTGIGYTVTAAMYSSDATVLPSPGTVYLNLYYK